MNRIILASHGGLSAGMKDTVQMILGEMPNLYALATLRDETEPITVAARRLLEGFAAEDAVYIVTDVMGGSVNNEMLTLLPEYPAVHLICGMNASLVLTLASNDEALTQDELAECIEDAKAQIIDCNLLLKNAAQDEEDTAIESLNLRKVCTVITSRPEPIRHFVTETLGRTATQQNATGVYTGEPRTMIMVALTRRQAGLLRDFLRREDPEAFLTIVNSSEIIGKGFQSI